MSQAIKDNPFEGASGASPQPQQPPAENPFQAPAQQVAVAPPNVENPFQPSNNGVGVTNQASPQATPEVSAPPTETAQGTPQEAPPIQQSPEQNAQVSTPEQVPTDAPVQTAEQPQTDGNQGISMNNQNPAFNQGQPPVMQQGGFPQPNGQQGGFAPQQMPQGGPPQGMPQGQPQQPATGFSQPNVQGGMNPAGSQNGGFAPQQMPQGGPPMQQGGFQQQGGFNNNGGGYNNNGGGGGGQRYNIVDFFWFINNKLRQQMQMGQGECSMITIGFNADFNNMRFSLLNVDPNVLSQPMISLEQCQKITNFNVHSEGAGMILANKGTGNQVMTQERVIRQGNWTPNQSIWMWSQDNVVVHTQTSAGAAHSYTFLGEQITLLESALSFMVDGSAWKAALAEGRT